MTEDQFEKLGQMITGVRSDMDVGFDKMAVMIKGVHDDLSAEMNERFEKVDARFEQIDARFEKVDARFEHVDARFDKVDTELAYIRAELRDLRNLFEALKEKAAGHDGFAKEIDHALARLVRVEQHVGLPVVA